MSECLLLTCFKHIAFCNEPNTVFDDVNHIHIYTNVETKNQFIGQSNKPTDHRINQLHGARRGLYYKHTMLHLNALCLALPFPHFRFFFSFNTGLDFHGSFLIILDYLPTSFSTACLHLTTSPH